MALSVVAYVWCVIVMEYYGGRAVVASGGRKKKDFVRFDSSMDLMENIKKK